MGKGFSSLFGEQKPQQQVTSSQPTGFDTLPQFGKDAFQQLIERGTALSQQSDLFAPGAIPAELTQSADMLRALGQSPDYLSRLTSFLNPYEEQVLQPAIRDINEQAALERSRIGSMATGAGGFGGTRQAILEAELEKNGLQNIGDISANTRSQGFNQALNAALSSLAQERQLGLGAAGGLGNIGQYLQGVNTQTQQAPLQAVNYLADLARSIPTGGGGQSFSYYQPPSPAGQIGGVLSALGSAFTPSAMTNLGGLSGFMFSDERLKENIVLVDRKGDVNIYEFNFIGSNNVYRGVIAQEIQKTHPDAVIEHFDGYLMVDYERINVPFEIRIEEDE